MEVLMLKKQQGEKEKIKERTNLKL